MFRLPYILQRITRNSNDIGGFAGFQEFRERFFRVEADVRTNLGLKFLGYLPLQ